MIVIRVELHSTRTGKATEIARMHISDIGGARRSASAAEREQPTELFDVINGATPGEGIP